MDFLISPTSIKFNNQVIGNYNYFQMIKNLGNMIVYVTKENEANIYY